MSAGYRQPRTDLTGYWLRQTPVDWALSKLHSPLGLVAGERAGLAWQETAIGLRGGGRPGCALLVSQLAPVFWRFLDAGCAKAPEGWRAPGPCGSSTARGELRYLAAALEGKGPAFSAFNQVGWCQTAPVCQRPRLNVL